ncbi:hypothetical protein ACJX0J_026353, partial [Zea mays]
SVDVLDIFLARKTRLILWIRIWHFKKIKELFLKIKNRAKDEDRACRIFRRNNKKNSFILPFELIIFISNN